MKQLEQIDNIAVRKLAGAGINSTEILEQTEAYRIEAIMQKNPPFGTKVLSRLADFPKLRVSVKQIGKEAKAGACVEVNLSAEIGFLNDSVLLAFHRKPIYVCFMAETSDGTIIDFQRIQTRRIQTEQEALFRAYLSMPTSHIACHVMCDEIAGTSRRAEIRLDHTPTHLFPRIQTLGRYRKRTPRSNVFPMIGSWKTVSQLLNRVDDFGNGGLEDDDLLAADTTDCAEVMDIATFLKMVTSHGPSGLTRRLRTAV